MSIVGTRFSSAMTVSCPRVSLNLTQCRKCVDVCVIRHLCSSICKESQRAVPESKSFQGTYASRRGLDHRKVRLEMLFECITELFGIDLLNLSILSKHCHADLRSRPDVVQTWSDSEVARRKLLIRPLARTESARGELTGWFRIVCARSAEMDNGRHYHPGASNRSRTRSVSVIFRDGRLRSTVGPNSRHPGSEERCNLGLCPFVTPY